MTASGKGGVKVALPTLRGAMGDEPREREASSVREVYRISNLLSPEPQRDESQATSASTSRKRFQDDTQGDDDDGAASSDGSSMEDASSSNETLIPFHDLTSSASEDVPELWAQVARLGEALQKTAQAQATQFSTMTTEAQLNSLQAAAHATHSASQLLVHIVRSRKAETPVRI